MRSAATSRKVVIRRSRETPDRSTRARESKDRSRSPLSRSAARASSSNSRPSPGESAAWSMTPPRSRILRMASRRNSSGSPRPWPTVRDPRLRTSSDDASQPKRSTTSARQARVTRFSPKPRNPGCTAHSKSSGRMRPVSSRDLAVNRQRSMRLAWPLRENTRTQSSMRSPVTGSGRGHHLQPRRRPPGSRGGRRGQAGEVVGALVAVGHRQAAHQPRQVGARLGAARAGHAPAEVPQHHGDDLLPRHPAPRQQGQGLGDGPAVAVQEPLAQQLEVHLLAPVSLLLHLDPHLAAGADLHREDGQVVAHVVETAAGLQVEAPAVPVAGEHAVAHHPAREGISHVGALVVGGVDAPPLVEQGDAAPLLAEAHGLGLAGIDLLHRGHLHPAVLRHSSSLSGQWASSQVSPVPISTTMGTSMGIASFISRATTSRTSSSSSR